MEEKIRAHIPNKEAILDSLSNQGLIAKSKHGFISQRLEERPDILGAKLCLTDKVSGIDWTHGYVLTAIVLKELKQDFNGVVLDFGTARGFPSIALAEALRESESNLPVVTMDILPHDEKMFWNSPIDRNGKNSS